LAYPRPLAELEGLAARLGAADRRFPGACACARGLLTLPTHSAVTLRDQERVRVWLGS
jgi:hypothetical protein